MRNDMSEWLIREGCPSIAYRVRKEIMQEHINRQEDIRYQNQICSEPKVQKILSWQGSDGYFGERLHTAPFKSGIWTHEGCVRWLLEMGLPKENENVWSALEVMFHPGWGSGWKMRCRGFGILRMPKDIRISFTGAPIKSLFLRRECMLGCKPEFPGGYRIFLASVL
ncbi:hypothetical protein ADH76_07765 [Enterocloster clostridioformis]|uniref:hypothetical protein n=1 Tax=Enterocloster clostridioformis TaxID=1531 RepID=UPI00080C7C32|nr:hypothetical protein [Enterocloster clostridioformis]ANU49761.1 hypothetical protein A4V08_31980 [Lachnoclostridium sp. YL32]NDO28764.1 hypothetical protein [Enterocloster clostridioformis]OXE71182.1 hypothetical protein ADH76_07765 [Enterocloster clostridioformis]QQR01330.1 hypothetical protein I5Q83_02665 [Enterocloster clostridioformis]